MKTVNPVLIVVSLVLGVAAGYYAARHFGDTTQASTKVAPTPSTRISVLKINHLKGERPSGLDDAVRYSPYSTRVVAASGDQGDYVICDGGLWLLRGTEAVKVHEVEKFSMPTTWKSFPPRSSVEVHTEQYNDNTPTDSGSTDSSDSNTEP